MSLLTVANQRGLGEFTGFTVKRGGDGGSSSGASQSFNDLKNQEEEGGVRSRMQGYNGDRELIEMVSALTHVSSSQMMVQTIGHKRERDHDEEISSSSNHIIQQPTLPRIFTTVMVPSQTSGAFLYHTFYLFHFFIKSYNIFL